LSGEAAWGRLWGAGTAPIRRTPVSLVPREELETWLALGDAPPAADGPTGATAVLSALQTRGAMFFQEIARFTGLPALDAEAALSELIACGLVTCDSFGGLRWLIVPASRRRAKALTAGRWSALVRGNGAGRPAEDPNGALFVARRLLARTGVVFRKTLAREKQPVPWREVARAMRALEARGEVRGGRFVAGFDGEQYALPDAVVLLREVRRRSEAGGSELPEVAVSAADPLNFRGILTPDDRVAATARRSVRVA